jgi:hypothetical protein
MFLEKKLVLWYTEDVNYYFMLSNKLCTLQMFCLLSKIMESIFWCNCSTNGVLEPFDLNGPLRLFYCLNYLNRLI